MTGMVVDDAWTPLERIVLEFRVMAFEAVELHRVARMALLVRGLAQIDIDTFVLLVAGRARETTPDHFVGREGDALRAGP